MEHSASPKNETKNNDHDQELRELCHRSQTCKNLFQILTLIIQKNSVLDESVPRMVL